MKLREIILFVLLLCSTAYASYVIPNGSVTSAKLAANSVTPNAMASSSVTSLAIANQAVTQNTLAPRAEITPAPSPSPGASPVISAGTVSVSASTGTGGTNFSGTLSYVSPMTLDIITTGRPVFLAITSDGTSNSYQMDFSSSSTYGQIKIVRDGSTTVGSWYGSGTATFSANGVPYYILDYPTSGLHSYQVWGQLQAGGVMGIYNAVLIAYEL